MSTQEIKVGDLVRRDVINARWRDICLHYGQDPFGSFLIREAPYKDALVPTVQIEEIPGLFIASYFRHDSTNVKVPTIPQVPEKSTGRVPLFRPGSSLEPPSMLRRHGVGDFVSFKLFDKAAKHE